jgi:hypothetical protein
VLSILGSKSNLCDCEHLLTELGGGDCQPHRRNGQPPERHRAPSPICLALRSESWSCLTILPRGNSTLCFVPSPALLHFIPLLFHRSATIKISFLDSGLGSSALDFCARHLVPVLALAPLLRVEPPKRQHSPILPCGPRSESWFCLAETALCVSFHPQPYFIPSPFLLSLS